LNWFLIACTVFTAIFVFFKAIYTEHHAHDITAYIRLGFLTFAILATICVYFEAIFAIHFA
jgi:phosphate starvation-inducible membrane PsiE